VLLTAGLGLFFMWRTASGDPGVLRVGLEGRAAGARVDGAGGRGDAAQRLDLPALWVGNWGAMCVSCKLVRPMGAKHCAVLNKCVSRFDHFCPCVFQALAGKFKHRLNQRRRANTIPRHRKTQALHVSQRRWRA
jgi:palmitoyltransferase